MKQKFKWFSIIFIGFMLIGMQISFAANPDSQTATTETEIAESDLAARDAYVRDLAEYWAAQSGESAENLEQIFSEATAQQLLAIDQSTVYEQVQAALDLGDLDQDFVFTPVTPCKIVDTRFGGGGFVNSFDERHYNVYGNLGGQGGSNCPSPRGEPRAVNISIGTAFATGTGNIQAYPFGAGPGAGLSENFASFAQAGYNFINTGPVRTCYGCGPDITMTSRFAGTNIVAFVLGYYHEVSRNDADRLALAFGVISSGGGRLSGTENWSSSYNAVSRRYQITISGVSYSDSGYTTVVTPVNFSPCADNIARTDAGSGQLWISFWDVEGTDVNTDQQCQFSWVTYRDR